MTTPRATSGWPQQSTHPAALVVGAGLLAAAPPACHSQEPDTQQPADDPTRTTGCTRAHTRSAPTLTLRPACCTHRHVFLLESWSSVGALTHRTAPHDHAMTDPYAATPSYAATSPQPSLPSHVGVGVSPLTAPPASVSVSVSPLTAHRPRRRRCLRSPHRPRGRRCLRSPLTARVGVGVPLTSPPASVSVSPLASPPASVSPLT